jgi:hypothetical protein
MRREEESHWSRYGHAEGDNDNQRNDTARHWGEQQSRDDFGRQRDHDRDYLEGRRDYRNTRGDYASRGDHDRRKEYERRGETRGGQNQGERYRYGEDDYSYRNREDSRQGRGEKDFESKRDVEKNYRGQYGRWAERKDEYGYGSHNYDVFGHEVNRGNRDQDQEQLTRGNRGDYESYRRYERGNPNYDNDYTTGFAGRNYSNRPHYGEDTRYGSDRNRNQSDRQDRGQERSYGYYDRNSGR